jgi:NADPH:quinone reductase
MHRSDNYAEGADMRAIVLHAFGPPGNLQPADVPVPSPGPGEALLDVELANITFVETQVRAGRPPNPAMLPTLPAILGNGVGGVVAGVGERVDRALLGRRVVSSLRGTGGYAEHAVAPAEALLEVPDGLALQDALAMLADGRTALLTFRAAPPQAGETALVLAAGGGVGSVLVQLARDAGARVVAAAGGKRKLALARELGTDAAIDYTRPGWTAEAGPVDVVFDGVGGALGRAALEQLRPGGRLHRIGMASGAFADITEDEAAARGLTLVSSPRPGSEQLRAFAREAIELAATGRLRATVGQTFPLERAADAHAAIESRATLGKTLLAVR